MNRQIIIDRNENKAIMVADNGYMLTNYVLGMPIEYYDAREAYDFPLTADGFALANSYREITTAQHESYIVAKEAEKDRIINLFNNMINSGATYGN